MTFKDYIERLGALHDCKVVRVELEPERRELVLHLEDLFANFEGLAEYPGAQPAQIYFGGIRSISGAIQPFERMMTHELMVEENEAGGSEAVMRFWPGGSFTVAFDSVTVRSGEAVLWPQPSV